jgi:hypothetical protein
MINARFQFRYDTAANWTANNPLLLAGELGLESDTNNFKLGNGISLWSSLPYVAAGPTGSQGPKGTLGNEGSVYLNFGSAPGNNYITTNIIGQANIVANSNILVWLDATAVNLTAHSADEYVLTDMNLLGSNITPGVGFTITASTDFYVTGNFYANWLWE